MALLLLAGPGLIPHAEWAAAAQETPVGYGVRPGDRITLDFYSSAGADVPVIAGTRIVNRNGQLFLPFVGAVDVRGMDAEGIRDRLEERYASFYTEPVIDVTVELRVNVTGAVGRPGNYFLSPSSTIIDALSEAGGASLDVAITGTQIPSDPSQVRLIRDGVTSILDLRPEEADPDVLNMRVQSGDWVFVPPRSRSRIREELTFWGSVTSFLTGIVGIVILLS